MLKPTFRFFVIPLGALGILAALSVQSASSRPARDVAPVSVREQVIDCSATNPAEVCVISFHGDTATR